MFETAATEHELEALVNGCLRGDRKSQELLYKQFYGYAMSVCLRYSRNKEEALEILNDGFLKVFTKTEKYNFQKSFKGWLRKILINTALDHYRQNLKHYYQEDVEAATNTAMQDTVLGNLAHEELIKLIQRLSPAYRMVFSLFVIDGYSHEEIAAQLNISVGSSKSNLARARINLKEMLKNTNSDEYAGNSRQ